MIIPIGKDSDHVFAMGHRVRTDSGGVRELKRRCLESLMHLDDPPDEVVFRALWLQPVASESGEHSVAPEQRSATRAQGGRRQR
jgi:hypothetical protein